MNLKTLKNESGYAHIECVSGIDGKPVWYAYIYMPSLDNGCAIGVPDHVYRRYRDGYHRVYDDGTGYRKLA